MSKEKFLIQLNVLFKKHGILDSQVIFTSINFVGYYGSQILSLICPGNGVATELQVGERPSRFQESHGFSFHLEGFKSVDNLKL